MILLPAVDILEGKAVRLAGGAFDAAVTYDADPLEAALRWVAQGARALHVVDLDGARGGRPVNLEHVRRIAAHVDVPIQLGGGLRSTDAVRAALEAGAARIVVGTAAYRDVDFLEAILADHGERVVVSVDVRDGRLATCGWTEQLAIPAAQVARALSARGVRRFVYSSVERDGCLTGPDLGAIRSIGRALRGTFNYSGGVSSLADLRALAALGQANLSGVIVGKALYEGRFTVQQGQLALEGRPDG